MGRDWLVRRLTTFHRLIPTNLALALFSHLPDTNRAGKASSICICRGAGNRTPATHSQSAYTTIMLHPEAANNVACEGQRIFNINIL